MSLAIITPGWMTSAYKTASALIKRTKLTVIIPRNKPFPGFNEKKNLKIYKMWDIFIPAPANFTITPGIFYTLLKVKKEQKPKGWIVYKHMFLTGFSVPLLKILGQKVILVTDTFPGHIWWTRSKIVNAVMFVFARTFGLLFLKSADKVVLLHEGLIEQAEKMKLNYTVIHNGVYPKNYDDANPSKDLTSKGKLIVTYIGRLHKVKGYDDLHHVAKKITRKYSNVEFWFVGKNEHNFKSTYNIKFLGFRSDIANVLKHTDIYVLPSYAEGLPNTLMEAMASRSACVSSAVGGCKVLITPNKNGLLFEAGNKKDMQKQIEKLIDNKKIRIQLGKNAYNTIKKDFNWNKLIEQWSKLIKNVCNTRI